jgi:transposase
MRIVRELDIHRRQITFNCLDERTGRCRTAGWPRRIGCCWAAGCGSTSTGRRRRSWSRLAPVGGSSWRSCSVPEWDAHLAEPAGTAAARGVRSGGPMTDRTDARQLRELLAAGRLPKSWIAPEQVLDMRARDLPRRSTANHRCRNRGGQWADPYRNSPTCTSVGV